MSDERGGPPGPAGGRRADGAGPDGAGPDGSGPDGSGARLGLRALGPYLREHRTALVVVALVSLVGAAASLAQPLLVGAIIAAVSAGASVAAPASVAVVVLVAGALLGGAQRYLLQRTAEGVVLSTRRRLVDRLLRLPVAEYDRRRTGDLMSRVGADTTLLRAVVTSGLVEVASSALVVVGAVVAMALVDVVLLAVTLAGVLTGVAAGVLVARRVRALSLAAQTRVGEMSAAVERSLSAVRTIRASGATDREAAAVVASAVAARDAGVRAAKVGAVVSPVMVVAVQGALVAVLAVGGARVASGALTVADLVQFVLYLFLLVLPLASTLQAYTLLQQGLGALTRIEEVVRLPLEDDDGPATPAPAPSVPAARTAPREEVAARRPADAPLLELEGVSFSYPDGTPVLHEVDLVVPRGSRTALVGPSGAGKSTLLALVERFHDVSAGALRLGGVDVRGLPRAAVRSRLGYVEQDAPVLAGTLADNLRLAAPAATGDDLRRVLAAVNLTALVDRSPEGLDAQVGEDGVRLSGGERQRLAIARSLLARPELLLLDEPTASLDARNEESLRAALAAAARESTLLVVAHRLSTVVDSDQIVVLEAGRVVGTGTHEELLDASPLYRGLAAAQLLVAR
ncbi:ABC transporter ATP-binding protein [Pseudokineococcus basanitobsidens]|uniref:ABC transporter ATP-binding protein n=1 Tax=Pseudokineococcus basanitobsidens TaxID=1926649 RepID=A0ABU8RK14_9ACTN